MRHRVVKNSFGRKSGPRKALIRGLVDSLVEHGRIKTTLKKAKELRRHVEKAITTGKAGDVHARRVLLSKYPNQDTVENIVSNISARFKDRPGGYTRILKLGARDGDNAEMAFIEFVDFDSNAESESDEERAQIQKLAQARAVKKRRHIRKIQSDSRKVNR